jgi:hypothetical protein
VEEGSFSGNLLVRDCPGGGGGFCVCVFTHERACVRACVCVCVCVCGCYWTETISAHWEPISPLIRYSIVSFPCLCLKVTNENNNRHGLKKHFIVAIEPTVGKEFTAIEPVLCI